MSKKSRTFQPDPTGKGATTPSTPPTSEGATSLPDASTSSSSGSTAPVAPTTPSTRPSSASRAEQRRKASSQGPRASQPQSLFEQYRALILGGAAVAAVVVVLFIMGLGANTKAYECVTFLTPPPAQAPTSPAAASPMATVPVTPAPTDAGDPATSAAPAGSGDPTSSAAPAGSAGPDASATPDTSPAPSPTPASTPQLGFVTQDLGKNHVTQGTVVKYGYCPPASGPHYNVSGQGPLSRQFYGPTTILNPGSWIHNLEHGYVVILYRGDADQAVIDGVQAIMAEATPKPETAARCGYSKVIGVRFDDMDPSVQVAALAWDRALLQTEFDKQELLTFTNQWQDGPQITETGLC
ncbi:MAG: DUF3105 domain-containing protein [Chloroflexi bacterium]|nr:DUF3105 domain-containing protein [Chloroflexota bacterium]